MEMNTKCPEIIPVLEWFEGIENGSYKTLDALFHEYHEELFGKCIAVLGSSASAKWIVEQTFIHFWNHPSLFQGFTSTGQCLGHISCQFMVKLVKNRINQQYPARKPEPHLPQEKVLNYIEINTFY